MISGHDLVLAGRTRGYEAGLILRHFRTKWPRAYVQDADQTEATPFSEVRFPKVTRDAEFFIYRDFQSVESWRASGATDENQSTMAHVIITDESVTIVTDLPGSPLSDFVEETLHSIAHNRVVSSAA